MWGGFFPQSPNSHQSPKSKNSTQKGVHMYIGIILRLIFGYVRIEVEGYYIERFINICQNKKILIWNLKRQKGVKLYLNIGIKDFKKLKAIARKTKCKINSVILITSLWCVQMLKDHDLRRLEEDVVGEITRMRV